MNDRTLPADECLCDNKTQLACPIHGVDRRPKAVHDEQRCRLIWIIAKSGECVVGFAGGSFMAFTDAAGAAWTLRQWADGIERDGQTEKTP